jgi:Anti-sigma factor NepR
MAARFPTEDTMDARKKTGPSLGLNSASRATLTDALLVGRIGRELRSLYQDVVNGPLPENLAVLVQRLAERDGQSNPEQEQD